MEGFKKSTVDIVKDTQVDTITFQLGTDPYKGTPHSRLTDWYLHDTKVGHRWGEGIEKFNTAGEWRCYENARQMIEDEGDDPPAALIRFAHEEDISVFLSLRVNDMHDHRLDIDDPYMSFTKREHQDWLQWSETDVWAKYGFDFAVEGVRDYKVALAEEAILKYDLDGLDLDFCRFTPYFKNPQQPGRHEMMTDMVRKIKKILVEKSEKIGRHLELSVRMPSPYEYAMDVGFDIPTWIKEELIDVMVVGYERTPQYRTMVEPYLEAAKGSDVLVIAQGLGCYRQMRSASARVLFNDYAEYSPEMCRANAASYWQAGVDGILIFNNQFIKFYHDDNYTGQPWSEIGDPEVLKNLDKHYLVDVAQAKGILPIEIDKPGDKAEVKLDFADNLKEAEEKGILDSVILRIMVENLSIIDEISIKLNGKLLDCKTAKRRLNYNDCWLDFTLGTTDLKNSFNNIAVEVVSRNPKICGKMSLEAVEILVKYK
ncbi:MAG: family 10 glycosylhydrolase [Planctomycetota bacterium]